MALATVEADLFPVSPTPCITPHRVLIALDSCLFRFVDEDDLQKGVAQALNRINVRYEREKVLSPQDRPDFLIDGHIALEIKIKGSIAQALRQVNRYAQHDQVSSVLLVGSPGWLNRVPNSIGGKPVYALRLTGSLL